MHIDSASTTVRGKTYTRHLLRETYRKDGKVCHRTLLNLKNCSEEEIAAMKFALQNKSKVATLTTAALGIQLCQGHSVGALLILQHLAKATGLTKTLGNTREGKLALFQVFARVIDQGSRLSAVRLSKSHDVAGVMGVTFNEEDLYQNLDWLTDHQDRIENALYADNQGKNELFLYDVSSSYFEGETNELAEFGYNRDKKKGKRQIVLGLLCDERGIPVSIQVFSGNTNDTKTFKDQADKVVQRFGGGSVTFVGDGGMIKAPQIKDLKSVGFHYITSIGKRQINTLLKNGILQLSLFDNELCEIIREEEGLRYILRRNPVRMAEIRSTRESQRVTLQKWINVCNLYLQEHPKAKPEIYLSKLTAKIKKLSLSSFIQGGTEGRSIHLNIDAAKQAECEELDGCYVVKTDLSVEVASKEVVHARYKALINVEYAFRTFKTGHLELRPIYVRKESRTRGHALVVMLAYRLTQELSRLWSNLEITPEEGIGVLSQFCTTELIVGDKSHGYQFQQPNVQTAALFKAADFVLPKKYIEHKKVKTKGVSTKTSLKKIGKSLRGFFK